MGFGFDGTGDIFNRTEPNLVLPKFYILTSHLPRYELSMVARGFALMGI